MVRKYRLFLCVWMCLAGGIALGQVRYRVVSYNVENLFDIQDDPLTQDEDFTPVGKLHWTSVRYTDKLLKLAGTIQAVGEGAWPTFVALCEVENRRVLNDLINKTKVADGNYTIVHQDSPDPRGIDVALLYRKEDYMLIQKRFITVYFPEDTTVRTRDILYTSGVLAGKDTLHLFVCHFPSMSGGEVESEWKRERAAMTVKTKIDSILHIDLQAAILIMGDLNGRADRPAQSVTLGVRNPDVKEWENGTLYNTGYYLLRENQGSYKYKGEWQTIDHIIVSGSLLNGHSSLCADKHLKPFAASFLLEEEKNGYGYKPFRTYLGPRYNGGYSDHLPVYLDLK